MACSSGIHCTTGSETWIWTSEEPPYCLGWFTAAYAAVMYTRLPEPTLVFVLLSQVVIELAHVFRAWFMKGNGPLEPNPGGVMGLFFGMHPNVESLLISYPLLAVIGAYLAFIVIKSWGTPVFLEKYSENTERRQNTGKAIWYLRQVKYSLQLVLIAYFPHWIAFGISASTLGTNERIALLVIWMGCNLFLITLFWWWNLDEVNVIWESQKDVSAKVRHNRFYVAWAAVITLFWLPIVVLANTGIPSQMRALIGCVLVFAVLVPSLWKIASHKLIRS